MNTTYDGEYNNALFINNAVVLTCMLCSSDFQGCLHLSVAINHLELVYPRRVRKVNEKFGTLCATLAIESFVEYIYHRRLRYGCTNFYRSYS